MLGRLLKYEFKATSRTFVPLYIAIILVSLLVGVFFDFNGGDQISFNIILILILGALFIALGVLTLLAIIQRFNKNLLGDEGYLMFTLPVTAKKIILSKVIVPVVWFLLSSIVSIISFFTIGLSLSIKEGGVNQGEVNMTNLVKFIAEILRNPSQEEWKFIGQAMEVGVLGLISFGVFVLMIYLCIAIGQLPVFSKHKIAVAFIAFFIINVIVNYVSYLVVESFIWNYSSSFQYSMLISYLGTIILGLVTFFSTSFILEKKLNLE